MTKMSKEYMAAYRARKKADHFPISAQEEKVVGVPSDYDFDSPIETRKMRVPDPVIAAAKASTIREQAAEIAALQAEVRELKRQLSLRPEKPFDEWGDRTGSRPGGEAPQAQGGGDWHRLRRLPPSIANHGRDEGGGAEPTVAQRQEVSWAKAPGMTVDPYAIVSSQIVQRFVMLAAEVTNGDYIIMSPKNAQELARVLVLDHDWPGGVMAFADWPDVLTIARFT
jgi:hypothetical protein